MKAIEQISMLKSEVVQIKIVCGKLQMKIEELEKENRLMADQLRKNGDAEYQKQMAERKKLLKQQLKLLAEQEVM